MPKAASITGTSNPRRRRNPNHPNDSATAVNGSPSFVPDRIAADCMGAVIANVVVAAPPEGVTVAGLNTHTAPDGKPEQAKLTAALNPFCGVTVSIVVPAPPELIVNDAGDASRVKLAGGSVIVYVADATALVE